MDNTQITDPLTKKMFHSYIDEILIYYHKELQSDPNSIKRIRNIKYFTNKSYNQKREYSSLSGPQNIDKLEPKYSKSYSVTKVPKILSYLEKIKSLPLGADDNVKRELQLQQK